MTKARIVFYDVATGIKWDTTVIFVSEDDEGNPTVPGASSELYRMIVQQAVENIWGSGCIWRGNGKYDTGRVMKKNEPVTAVLQVSIV